MLKMPVVLCVDYTNINTAYNSGLRVSMETPSIQKLHPIII